MSIIKNFSLDDFKEKTGTPFPEATGRFIEHLEEQLKSSWKIIACEGWKHPEKGYFLQLNIKLSDGELIELLEWNKVDSCENRNSFTTIFLNLHDLKIMMQSIGIKNK